MKYRLVGNESTSNKKAKLSLNLFCALGSDLEPQSFASKTVKNSSYTENCLSFFLTVISSTCNLKRAYNERFLKEQLMFVLI